MRQEQEAQRSLLRPVIRSIHHTLLCVAAIAKAQKYAYDDVHDVHGVHDGGEVRHGGVLHRDVRVASCESFLYCNAFSQASQFEMPPGLFPLLLFLNAVNFTPLLATFADSA